MPISHTIVMNEKLYALISQSQNTRLNHKASYGFVWRALTTSAKYEARKRQQKTHNTLIKSLFLQHHCVFGLTTRCTRLATISSYMIHLV
mgnify:CR=1 FL=1